MAHWVVAPVVCERTAYVYDKSRGWVWVYFSWRTHPQQAAVADCGSPAWRPQESQRQELHDLANAIAQTLQLNASSFASVPAVAETAETAVIKNQVSMTSFYCPCIMLGKMPMHMKTTSWSDCFLWWIEKKDCVILTICALCVCHFQGIQF